MLKTEKHRKGVERGDGDMVGAKGGQNCVAKTSTTVSDILTKMYHPSLEKATTNLYSAIEIVSSFQRWMVMHSCCGQNP